LCHPLGELGVTYTVHILLVGKCVVDFLLALIELFSLAFTVEMLWANIGRNCAVWKGGGSIWAQISGGSCLNCTQFGKWILRKIIKIVANRCHILKLKCTKFVFGRGSAPDSAGGAYDAPPDPLVSLGGGYPLPICDGLAVRHSHVTSLASWVLQADETTRRQRPLWAIEQNVDTERCTERSLFCTLNIYMANKRKEKYFVVTNTVIPFPTPTPSTPLASRSRRLWCPFQMDWTPALVKS